MTVALRVLTWNICEGRHNAPKDVYNTQLDALAAAIRSEAPDIALLNEVVNYDRVNGGVGGGTMQDRWLSEHCQLPYMVSTQMNTLGWTGHKMLAVLSRYPLAQQKTHPTIKPDRGRAAFGAMQTAVTIEGRRIELFTLRFIPHHTDLSNPETKDDAWNYPFLSPAAHRQLGDYVRERVATPDVIVGGDFNAPWKSGECLTFRNQSALRSTMAERPDPARDEIDLVYWRGADELIEFRTVSTGASDHSYIVTTFSSAGDFPVFYGSTVKIKHRHSGVHLHSHLNRYSHPNGSAQQQVTGFAGDDDNDWWKVVGPHGHGDLFNNGQLVGHGDIIRLRHVKTQRLLHSHLGHPSPVSAQQEVSCFSIQAGIGDTNDNWRIEIVGGGPGMPWDTSRRFVLTHVNTGKRLHSHYGYSDPVQTAGQQEVTAFEPAGGAQDDPNDHWELHQRT